MSTYYREIKIHITKTQLGKSMSFIGIITGIFYKVYITSLSLSCQFPNDDKETYY